MTARRPRVLFGIGGLGLGGSETQLVELLTRTHGTLLDACVVTWAVDASYAPVHREKLRAASVPTISLGPFSTPRGLRPPLALLRLAKIMRAWKPDVIYPWLEEASALMLPIGKLTGVSSLVARRNVSGARIERLPLAGGLIREIESRADLVTCNSEAGVRAAEARGIQSNRIRLVRNGHVAGHTFPAPDGEPVVLGYVGRFRPEKGHRRLIAALTAIEARRPWRIDLAGDGPLEKEIRELVRTAGLQDRVRLLGPVDGIAEFWADRAIAVLLSDHEGSPNALIEAALAGRPLIATDVGGTSEVVQPAGGMLVAPDDHAGITHALATLIDDPEQRARMGQQARAQALERFSVEKFVAGHVAAIDEAVTRRADVNGTEP